VDLRPLRHIAPLDGIRAVAVAMVFASHLLPGLFHGGAMGVDAFFALSGFLITTLLLDERLANQHHVRLGAFYARRALRLFPALYLMLAILAMVLLIDHDGLQVDRAWRSMIGAATYTTNLPFITRNRAFPARHTWSLAVEEQFYLIWPLILLGTYRLRGQRWLASALGALIVAGVAVRAAGQAPSVWFMTSRPESLAAGSLLAIVRHESRFARHLLAQHGARISAAAFAVVIGWFCFVNATAYWELNDRVGYTGVGIASALLAVALASEPTWPGGPSRLGRLLATTSVARVGRLSYGIYLWHLPVIWSANRNLGALPSPIRIVVIVAVTVAITELSYRFVEQPALRLSRRVRPPTDWTEPVDVAPIGRHAPG